jgi:hypothetical protein
MFGLISEILIYTFQAPAWNTKHSNRHEDFRLCSIGMQHSLLSFFGDDFTSLQHWLSYITRSGF